MNSLLRFLIKYQFLLLFIVLEIISFWLIAKHTYYQKSRFENVSRTITGHIHQKIDNARIYLSLAEINENLAKENLELRQKLALLSVKVESNYLAEKEFSTDTLYSFIPAKVINNSVNKQYNYLTLNVGKQQGIEPEMGVITSNGVIGIIVGVSEHYSTAISLLNVDLKISAKLKNTNYFGSLFWDGKDYREVILGDIPQHVSINVGDTIITSGFSAIFPPDIDLGTVKSFDSRESNFFTIRANLFNDFKMINYVWVVKNLRGKEKELLEETAILN